MYFRKILVIYKKSTLQLAKERKNKKILELVEMNDPSVAGYKDSHDSHVTTLEKVRQEFGKHDFEKVDFRYRADAELVKKYNIIVAVGGDGTFLWASKFTGPDTVLTGINSSPKTSVGFFTACKPDGVEFLAWRIANAHKSNLIEPKELKRLQVKINGEVVHDKILNDVYFGAVHPAAMTRYLLTVPEANNGAAVTEEQKSGGVWISTAPGSTGANLSSGGWILPIEDSRIQYTVREPMKNFISGSEYRLIHGLFNPETCKQKSVKIICKTRKAMIACDGTTLTTPVTVGDEIEIMPSKERLLVHI